MAPVIAPNYADLDRLLSAVELAPSPAEAQAILCGLLAAQVSDPVRRWRAQLLAPPSASEGFGHLSADLAEASGAVRDITFEGRGPIIEADCRHGHGHGHGHEHGHELGHEHGHDDDCAHAQGATETAEEGIEEGERDEMLTALAHWTAAAINPPSVSFDLLLPPEDQPLLARATAVHDWIRGAVYGLALGGVERDGLDSEAREAFDDLVELTRMDLTSIEGGEEDEQALMEVVEFLRVALMAIRESSPPARRASEPQSNKAEL
jgi:uncharacterized protein YgfB (UPF0149 family)